MRGHSVIMAAAVTAAAFCSVLISGATASAAGTWGTAQEVPGTASLNQGGEAETDAVSCASAGNCSAVGDYRTATGASGQRQLFVAEETSGTWGTAREMPGIAALNQGGFAVVKSLSCASAGNCGAGGFYGDGFGNVQAFVASETNGSWGTAQEVPGTASLNEGGQAQIDAVSCGSAGNCSAGGFYTGASGTDLPFLADETNGTWGAAQEVPGIGAIGHGGFAFIRSVSCASAGNCSAGGASSGGAFVVGEADGTWGKAKQLPGMGSYGVYEVSCASVGNCGATSGGTSVANETGGIWGTAQDVPGLAALDQGGSAQVYHVSCGSAGNCGAGGIYSIPTDGTPPEQVFVVGETDGTWGTAEDLPGLAALNTYDDAELYSLSCASAGNCAAAGFYTDASGMHAFVASETSGTWGTEEVPGLGTLNQSGLAVTNSVSCGAAGNCSAGGGYTDTSGHLQAFAVDEN